MRPRDFLIRLMNSDASTPLAVLALIFISVGYFYGFAIMARVAAYVLGGLVAIGFLLLAIYSQQARAAQLDDAAAEYGGSVGKRWPLGRRQLDFQRNGKQFRVRIDRCRHHSESLEPRGDIMRLEGAWPDRHLSLLVEETSLSTTLRKLFDWQRIDIHGPAFDDYFVASGNDEPRIRSILNKKVQQSLLELNDQKYPAVRIQYGTICVSADYYTQTTELSAFINAALNLCDALSEANLAAR
jgi:hypothetical protein